MAPRLIRHRGKARVTALHDEKGRKTGFHIETGDGRQAAVVRPETIRQRVSMSGKETR